MAEASTSTLLPESGEVRVVVGVLPQQDEPAAPAQEAPKQPVPTIPYSWRAFEPQPTFEYVTDSDRADELLTGLQPCAFGFDTEWKPVFRKGQPENKVALIQLANNEVIYLLQVSAMQRFPESLRVILESEEYTKAGVGIQGDAKKVYRDCGVSMRSCIDLSLLARSVDSRWKGKYTNPIGLANLVATYEFLALGKGKITRSDWEARLSFNQQEYAANDGHSGYTIYCRLIEMASTMVDPPAASCYSFNVRGGLLFDLLGGMWIPKNPNYDPGPPPPPRPPKEKGDSEGQQVSKQHRQNARGWRRYQVDDWKPLDRFDGVDSGPSSGQTSGVRKSKGRGGGYMGHGPFRQPQHGRGRGIGMVNKSGP